MISWPILLTLPLKLVQKYFAFLSCLRLYKKVELGKPFVSISANCLEEGVYRGQISPLSSFSLMKCQSISTCLVRSWWMGLWDIFIAAWLSQYNLMGPFKVMPRLVRMIFIQISSQIHWAMNLNSTYALGITTIGCFFTSLSN